MSAFAQAREQRLRGLYVHGEIEVDEFDLRLGALLREQPWPEDEAISGLVLYTDKPGVIFPYTPVLSSAYANAIKEAWTRDRLVGPEDEDDPETARPGNWEKD